jgi:hypothetical protein
MRYLSQLARETTARLKVSRQPSWLRPVGMVIQDEASIPMTPPQAARTQNEFEHVRTAGPAAAPSRTAPREQEPETRRQRLAPAADELPQQPLQRAPQAEPPQSEPRRSADEAVPASHAIPNAAEEKSATLEIDDGLFPTANARAERVTQQQQPAAAHTLRSVLAELSRRQEELERQQIDARRTPVVEVLREERTHPERLISERAASKEEVRLNIGSIVVQLEPDPAERVTAPAQPVRLAPQRSEQQSSDRWARSFLDR